MTKPTINAGVLERILFEAQCATFIAIDNAISENLELPQKAWIKDKHLPDLIPAIDKAVKAALSEKYYLVETDNYER